MTLCPTFGSGNGARLHEIDTSGRQPPFTKGKVSLSLSGLTMQRGQCGADVGRQILATIAVPVVKGPAEDMAYNSPLRAPLCTSLSNRPVDRSAGNVILQVDRAEQVKAQKY